jgi:hypothetical protein
MTVKHANLPDFIIIGAPKAGTTSLYRYLGTHPQIYMSPVKEPRYMAFPDRKPAFRGTAAREFNNAVVWRFDDYRNLFAERRDERMAGEASPLYLWSEEAPTTMRRIVPDVKLVAILRDPVARAHSHFCHNRRLGREPFADFRDALDAEPERIARGWNPNIQYRGRGRYGEQIRRFLSVFPRDQLLVLLQADMRKRPAETLAELCRFLGVDDTFEFDTTARYNVTDGMPRRIWLSRLFVAESGLKRAARRVVPESVRSALFEKYYHSNLEPRPALDPDVRRLLRAEFREDILLLQELIDRDLAVWLRE